MIRYAKLAFTFDAETTKAELQSFGSGWQAHLNTFQYTGAWTVLALRSPGGSHKNIIPDLLNENGFMDTIYMEHFASVKTLLLKLDCPIMSARFLNLQAGAVIKEHNDKELAFEKGEARLHFPIITNPGVEFYCENEQIILDEGECWYLNANLPHRVSNNSDKDRIHLVVDCEVNDWLGSLINSSDKIAFKKEVVDDNLLNLIKHLRYQNTDVSNKQADELDKKVREIRIANPDNE